MGKFLGRLEVGGEKWRAEVQKRNISETRKDRGKVTIWRACRKSPTLFRTVPFQTPSFSEIGGSQPTRKIPIAIISLTGKATDFRFGRYIHRSHPSKSPLKILEKRERGRIQGLPKFFWVAPIISGTGKATKFQFCAHIKAQSEQKPIKNIRGSGRGRRQGLPKIFQAPIIAHRAVIFAIAQLSCFAGEGCDRERHGRVQCACCSIIAVMDYPHFEASNSTATLTFVAGDSTPVWTYETLEDCVLCHCQLDHGLVNKPAK